MIDGKIYKITNLKNLKIYVGQTTDTLNRRLGKHFSDTGCVYLHRAILKHGRENFCIELLEGQILSRELLNTKEADWIEKLNCRKRSIGYNIKPGGNVSGHSAETRAKLSLSKMGSKNPMYGKPQSKETIEKRSSSLKGQKRSDSQKKFQQTCNTQKKAIICIETGEIFPSIMQARIDLNLDSRKIYEVLKGCRTHTKGYSFTYVNPEERVPPKVNLSKEERRSRLIGRIMPNSKTVYCSNGKTYPSVASASRDLNIGYSLILSTITQGSGRKTAKGYSFSLSPLPIKN